MADQLGINRSSPLIYWTLLAVIAAGAGNQSFIPFDILTQNEPGTPIGWESIVHPL